MEGESLLPVAATLSQSLTRKNSHGSGSNIALQNEGDEDTLEFRIQAVESTKKVISLWHDISLTHIDPLTGQGTPYLNFVCEIPKFTRCVTTLNMTIVKWKQKLTNVATVSVCGS